MKSEWGGGGRREAHSVEPGRVNGVLRNRTERNKCASVGEKMVVRRRQAQKQPPEQKQWESDCAWTWWWALAIQAQKQRQENQESEYSLGYRKSLKRARAT